MNRARFRHIRMLAIGLLPLCMCIPMQLHMRTKKQETKDVAAEQPAQHVKADSVATPGKAQPQKPAPAPEPEPVDTPASLPVEKWKGKTFLILKKVEMFRKHGHHLYTSAAFEDDPAPANPAIELKNHRLKYTPFAGRKMTVLDIEPYEEGEFLVTGRLDTLDLIVFGRTRGGIIEGLLLESDLEKARARWKKKTIYSRRRLIDIYDAKSSSFKNYKVSILEPLTVTAVSPGIIPLPPKPIWLKVKRKDGGAGIIPMNYSYTNVLKEKQLPCMPWEMDIFEEAPKKIYPAWDEYTWKTIDNHSIYAGMTKQQVQVSWGIARQTRKIDSTSVEWIYGNSTLLFSGDSLVSQK